MTLEAASSEAVFFVTLTMSNEYLQSEERKVQCEKDVTPRDVSVREIQLFLKRLRFGLCGEPVRYYAVGEYGEHTRRPHYHAVLFGSSRLCGAAEGKFGAAWPHGGVHVGLGDWDSYGYICGYVTKGLTRRGDPALAGRRPEFARMSLKPGIGTVGLGAIAEWCVSSEGAKWIAANRDVPRSIRVQGRIAPIGRYLVQRLRALVGIEHDPKRAFKELGEQTYFEIFKEGGRTAREAKRRQIERQAVTKVRIKQSTRTML